MFEFARPDLRVYALPILALLVLAMAWSRAVPQWGRRVVSWVLRAAALLLCLLALSLPEVRRDFEEEKALVLVVDVSDSIPRPDRERAAEEVKEVLDTLRHRPAVAEPPSPWIERMLGSGDRPQGLTEEFLARSGRTSTALIAFAGQASVLARCPGGALPWTSDVEAALLDEGPRDEGDPLHSRVIAELDPSHSRITPALTLAASVFPGVADRRVLVWTDGRLEEPAATAAEWRAACGARSLALYPIGPEAPRDVRVVDLQCPSEVAVNELWNAVLTLESTAPGKAQVTLKDGVKVISSSEVTLVAGRQEATFPNLQLSAGGHLITASVEMPGDAEPRNDVGLAAVWVRGKYRLLVIEGVRDSGEAVARALAAQDLTVERGVPASLAGARLGDYSAVVLAEVAPKDLPKASQEALRTYVEDQGGGLLVLTGPRQDVAAGFRKSILEGLLPVSFREPEPAPPKPHEPPKPAPAPPKPHPSPDPKHAKVQVPDVVLLLLIDKSGSMAGKKINLAKEAAIATAKTLQDDDRIGVIVFDSEPTWVLDEGIVPASQRAILEERLSRLQAGGGTDIYRAMVGGYQALHMVSAQVKHMVVMTDGYTDLADFEGLVKRMAKEKITVSTVGIGDEFDGNLLARIAEWGRGRFNYTNDFDEIPQIFVQETQKVLSTVSRKGNPPPTPPKPAPQKPNTPVPDLGKPSEKHDPTPLKETPPEPATVKLKDDVTFLKGVDLRTLPPIDKRVRLGERVGFFPIVTEGEEEPVLAAGRAGLGRTAVFASDLRGEGAPEWVRWKELPRLLAQLAKSLAAAPGERKLSTRVSYRLEDRAAVLFVDVPEERMNGVKDLVQRLRWRTPDGEVMDLPLDRTAPGRYEARAPLEKAGRFYVAELEQHASGGIQEVTTAGVARAYDAEFARVGRDLVRFRRLLAGGGAVERPTATEAASVPATVRTTRWGYGAWFVLLAAALLPLDLAVRRWRR